MVDAAAGRCVCGGTGLVDVEADEDPGIVFQLARRRRVAGLYQAAQRALRLARQYRRETIALRDSRIAGCVNAVVGCRREIASLRGMPVPADAMLEAAE